MSMNDPNDIIFREEFKIRAHEVNVNKVLTIPSMLKLMQEASMGSAEQLKVSVWELEKYNLAWVLLRKHLKVISLPKLGDQIVVTTNPSGFDRAFAYRDYRAFDSEGKLLASASSTWTLLDLATRRMAKIPQSLLDLALPGDILEKPARKIPKVENPSHKKENQISYFDLDWNGHVNNINYVKYMLEVLDVDRLQNRDLLEFQFQVKSESFLNNHVITRAELYSDKEIRHELIDQNTQNVIAQAHSLWA
jgi:medium-chain acyl-[acyl-carrier-protein] hydrolase